MESEVKKHRGLFVMNLSVHVLLMGGLYLALRGFERLCGWYDGAPTRSARQLIHECVGNIHAVEIIGLGLLLASAALYFIARNNRRRLRYIFIIFLGLEVFYLLDKSMIAKNEFFVFLVPVLGFLIFCHAFSLYGMIRSNTTPGQKINDAKTDDF